MAEILVIRFSSLGDLCLLSWAAAARRDGRPAASAERVTLVTKPQYADLMTRMRGIDTVVVPAGAGPGAIAALARRLRRSRFTEVLDAHNVLRSHLLLGLMGRRPDRRLAKDTAARLRFLRTGRRSAALERHMTDRFGEVLACTVTPACVPPLAIPAAGAENSGPTLGLAPGAMWDTKRWPAAHFRRLAEEFRRRTGAGLRIFLGPREEAWFDSSPLASLADSPSVRVVRGRTLVEVAQELAACTLLVTNDSGLLHLAEATGTPVLAFFGPTVREFGYYPLLPGSGVLERDLDCRPCSRNGKRPCHRQDLACLAQITPDQALDALLPRWEELTAGRPA